MEKIYKRTAFINLVTLFYLFVIISSSIAQTPFIPSNEELNRPFGDYDYENFKSPPKV